MIASPHFLPDLVPAMEEQTAIDGGVSQLSMGLLLPDVVHRIYEEGQVRAWAALSRRVRPPVHAFPLPFPLLARSATAREREARGHGGAESSRKARTLVPPVRCPCRHCGGIMSHAATR